MPLHILCYECLSSQLTNGTYNLPLYFLSHRQKDIKAMFDPNPPVQFARPLKKPQVKPYTGVAQYVGLFEKEEPPKRPEFVTHKQRKVTKEEDYDYLSD